MEKKKKEQVFEESKIEGAVQARLAPLFVVQDGMNYKVGFFPAFLHRIWIVF